MIVNVITGDSSHRGAPPGFRHGLAEDPADPHRRREEAGRHCEPRRHLPRRFRSRRRPQMTESTAMTIMELLEQRGAGRARPDGARLPDDPLRRASRNGPLPRRAARRAGIRKGRPHRDRHGERAAAGAGDPRRVLLLHGRPAESEIPGRGVRVLLRGRRRQGADRHAGHRSGRLRGGHARDAGDPRRHRPLGGAALRSRRSRGPRQRAGAPGPRRHRDPAAHQRHHEAAQACPDPPPQPGRLGDERRPYLRPDGEGRLAVRDAAVPHPRDLRFAAGPPGRRRLDGLPAAVRRAALLGLGGRVPPHVVFGRPLDAPDAAGRAPSGARI